MPEPQRSVWHVLLDDISAGQTNPFTEETESLLCDMVARSLVTVNAVQLACDRYVVAKAVGMLSEVAAGKIAYSDPSVCRVLERAVVLGVFDASVLEHMNIVYAIANIRTRSRC